MLLHLQGVTRLREPILNLQGISQRETEQLPYLAMPSSAFLEEYAKDHHRPTVVSTSSLKHKACSLIESDGPWPDLGNIRVTVIR